IAGPYPLFGSVLAFQQRTGLLRTDTLFVHPLLGERSQFGAEFADLGAFRVDKDAVLIEALAADHFQRSDANFDNFAFLPFWRRSGPAGRFYVDHQNLVEFTGHSVLDPPHNLKPPIGSGVTESLLAFKKMAALSVSLDQAY